MLNLKKTALVVVDIQGKLASLVHESEALVASTANLVRGAQALDLPILWVEQNPQKLGGTVPELAELLSPLEPMAKMTFSACGAEVFAQAVRGCGAEQFLLCGIEAHICVYQTAMGLQALGHEVQLVVDCVSSRNPSNKALAIDKMTSKGIDVTSVEMCLYELLGDCEAPAFKPVLKLVK